MLHRVFCIHLILDFILLFNHRLPFDWTKPLGYFSTILFQSLIFIGSGVSTLAVFLVFYVFYQILIAFTMDLIQSINELNFCIIFERKPLSAPCCSRIEEKFCEIIQFHADAKRFVDCDTKLHCLQFYLHFSLAEEFVDTFKRIIFVCLAYSAVMITTSLLEIQRVIEFQAKSFRNE